MHSWLYRLHSQSFSVSCLLSHLSVAHPALVHCLPTSFHCRSTHGLVPMTQLSFTPFAPVFIVPCCHPPCLSWSLVLVSTTCISSSVVLVRVLIQPPASSKSHLHHWLRSVSSLMLMPSDLNKSKPHLLPIGGQGECIQILGIDPSYIVCTWVILILNTSSCCAISKCQPISDHAWSKSLVLPCWILSELACTVRKNNC